MAAFKRIKLSSLHSPGKSIQLGTPVALGALVGAVIVSVAIGPIIYLALPSLQMIYLNLATNSLFY